MILSSILYVIAILSLGSGELIMSHVIAIG